MKPLTDKQKVFAANPDDPRHGTENGYVNLACHCDRCKVAHAAYHKRYRDRYPVQRTKNAQRGNLTTWGIPAPLYKLGYLTASSVARRMGVDKATFSRWGIEPNFVTPNGKRLYSPEAVRQIADDRISQELLALAKRHEATSTLADFERLVRALVRAADAQRTSRPLSVARALGAGHQDAAGLTPLPPGVVSPAAAI